MSLSRTMNALGRIGLLAGAAIMMAKPGVAQTAEACVACIDEHNCRGDMYSGATDCSFSSGKCKLIGEICTGT